MFNLPPIGLTMRAKLRSLPGSPVFRWTLLAQPSVGMLAGGMDYSEVMHASGEFSARLVILSLAVTPLVTLFPVGLGAVGCSAGAVGSASPPSATASCTRSST